MRGVLRVIFVIGCMGLNLACSTSRFLPSPVSNSRSGFLDDSATGIVSQFTWPLKEVKVTSPFGQRGKEYHEGVDLRAPLGTPVFAAQSGKILYAGAKIRGYGQMIVIRHSKKVVSLYAHNSKLLVRKGQWVHQGQLISQSGNTGHSQGAHLHFEIRNGLTALNPLKCVHQKI